MNAATKVRQIRKSAGQLDLRCSGCERRCHALFWLQHDDAQLPLTMWLCRDCFAGAAQRVESLLAEDPQGEDFGNHPAAA